MYCYYCRHQLVFVDSYKSKGNVITKLRCSSLSCRATFNCVKEFEETECLRCSYGVEGHKECF